jgi:hypothetical protein
MVREISDVDVFTAGASASTVTVSETPPTDSDASTRAVSLTFSTMPVRVEVLNPDSVTSTM